MINNIKNQRGITLITLIITIVLLIIITATIAINSHTSLELSNLTKLENDIQALNDRVAAYYVKTGTLPVTEETYTKSELEELITGISINDGDTYYTIDLSKLSNITLNYGKRYNDVESQDKYIINQDTHNIYYLNGIEYQGEKYYTLSQSNEVALTDHAAELVASRVTVTFDANGGTILASQNWTSSGEAVTKRITTDGTYGKLPTPTKEGYTFLGWQDAIYHEIEYIESTGTQYIDTGFVPNQDTSVEVKFSLQSNNGFLYQTRVSTNIDAFGFCYTQDNRLRFDYGSISDGFLTLPENIIDVTSVNTIKQDKNKYYINEKYVEEYSYLQFTSPGNLYLFAGNYNNESTGGYISARIYAFKIWDNGTLIRDFVPVYRITDNVIGLYDKVNGVFYINQGNGTFNKGNDKNEKYGRIVIENTTILYDEDHTLYARWGYNPIVTFDANGGNVSSSKKTYIYNSTYTDLPTPQRAGYTFVGWSKKHIKLPFEFQEIEYIESTGTQYIDTDFLPTMQSKILLDYKFLGTGTMGQNQIGCGQAEDDKRFAIALTSNSNFIFCIGKNITTEHQKDYNRHLFMIDMVNKKYGIDNNQYGFQLNSFNANLTFTLFKRRITSGFDYDGESRLYLFEAWNDNILTRNMLPCYRKSDNEIGLYDTINNVFYTNQGTGTFIKGADMETRYITSSTQMITNEDHTLYAIWQKNE